MNVYADEPFYKNNFLTWSKAAVPQNRFEFYAIKASRCIDRYTLGSIGGNVPDEVRYCCCELAELFYISEHAAGAKGIASEKVGDISRTYEGTEALQKSLSAQVRSVVCNWLADTGLLYRGGSLCTQQTAAPCI